MRAPRTCSRRPSGFLMVTVLVLLLIVVTMTVWMLRSSTIRNNVVQRQINSYESHMDMLSVRHIALRWISRQRGLDVLEELAGDPRVQTEAPLVYRAALPDGMSVRIYLQRGQGLAQRDVEAADGSTQRDLMRGVLTALEEEGATEEFTRNVGPTRMVLSTVPDALIDAVAVGQRSIADALRKARLEGDDTSAGIQRSLESFGVDQNQAAAIASELFTEQTRLWRLTVETEREGNQRSFALYMMREGEAAVLSWKVLEARLLPETEDENAIPARGARVR